MDLKAILMKMIPVLLALIIYDLVVKGALAKFTNKYDDTERLDGFDSVKHSRKDYGNERRIHAGNYRGVIA